MSKKTLKEIIAAGEAKGLTLIGFYVASDVKAALDAHPEIERLELAPQSILNPTPTLAIYEVTAMPKGCVAPKWREHDRPIDKPKLPPIEWFSPASYGVGRR